MRISVPILIVILLAATARSQEVTDVVEVVGQTPLGAGVDIDDIASNVQSATGEEMREQRALEMADFMRENLAGVFVNEAQSNPLQPDVQYRGFVGSPLLGLPQGIAVYVDGVRVNEPFGDTVNWALIPDSAIDTVYLMPGSNPLFGLNALGGAISIRTKDGMTNPGTRAELYGGSFGRLGVQAETGGASESLSWFVTGSWFEEDGWRDHSPTEALQLFGKLGWHSDVTSIDLGLSFADTDLIGNGPAPVQLLDVDREAIFTRPDHTVNDLLLFNLSAQHQLSDRLTLAGNAYLRNSDIDTLNGDDSDVKECAGTPGILCVEDDGQEVPVLDADDNPIAASEELEGATITRTGTRQDSIGFGLQASWTGNAGGRDNLLVFGASFDDSQVAFVASTELGTLDGTRFAVPGGTFIGDAFTELEADTRSFGLYASDTLALTERLTLTVSGRFNGIDVTLRDRLGTALNGDHRFHRFNPAAGVTAKLASNVTLYGSYGESNRAPSPVELTCADEDDPCRLPNAFLADPPLEQVVARTWEAGIRGHWTDGSWYAGVFRTTNEDDILFVSAGALTNEGFFDNVGRTRRDGIEIGLDGDVGDVLRWRMTYTFLDATFRDGVSLPSAHNPAAMDGEVTVRRGDRLPLLPRHLLKAGVQASIGERLTIGGQLLAGGDFPMRGDEGNDMAPVGDHTVLNLRGDYRLSDTMTLFLNVDNVLNEEYETFGLFGEADEVLGYGFDDSRFLSPASPRGAWVGVQLELR